MSCTVLIAAVLIIAGCSSPEIKRTRGGGPGADLGNRSDTVEIHEGADPYYRTPQLIDSKYAGAGKPAGSERASRK